MNKHRLACIQDLDNYINKKDLITKPGYLSDQEIRLIKEIFNTGSGAENQDPKVISEITYNELCNLIAFKMLVPAKRYKICDFQTIYNSGLKHDGKIDVWGLDGSKNPSEKMPLIITASTYETILRDVIIVGHEDWEVRYDPTKEVFYTTTEIDENTGEKKEVQIHSKGKITYLKDNFNNSAFYDFKNIKFRRYKDEISINSDYQDFYTFSAITNGKILDASLNDYTRNNTLKESCYNNVFLVTAKNNVFNNTFGAGCENNTFAKGIKNSDIKCESDNNTFNSPINNLNGYMRNVIVNSDNDILKSDYLKQITYIQKDESANLSSEICVVSYLDPYSFAWQPEALETKNYLCSV
jgi:hypothetical protein